jgi:uncharacterized protein with HEPN domain
MDRGDINITIFNCLRPYGPERIGAYLSGKDHQFFSDDFMTQDAVEQQLEIIGEAPKGYQKSYEI